MDTTIDPNNMPHVSDASVSVEIETEDMTLNIGPQHPSTHGVLRLVAKVDGEKISSVEPVLGYMHRGYEKLAEVRTYPQITTLVNRIDWVSGFANEIPFIAATEKLMEIEVPERAQHIRLILTEMARIASHALNLHRRRLGWGQENQKINVGRLRGDWRALGGVLVQVTIIHRVEQW